MGLPAEHAQHVEFAFVGLRQIRAGADADHLRAAGLVIPFQARKCLRYFGLAGSVTSTIDVPLNSACPVSLFIGFGTAVVPP